MLRRFLIFYNISCYNKTHLFVNRISSQGGYVNGLVPASARGGEAAGDQVAGAGLLVRVQARARCGPWRLSWSPRFPVECSLTIDDSELDITSVSDTIERPLMQ